MADTLVIVRPDPQPVAVTEPGYVPLGQAAPQALGAIAAAGVGLASSREDHVHPTDGLLLTGNLSNATPAAVLTGGTAGTAGVLGSTSRADHSHPISAVGVLASANTWTAGQTINLAADAVGLIVRGAAGGSLDLTRWQNSSGTSIVVIDSSGRLGMGASPSTGNLLSQETTLHPGGGTTVRGYYSNFIVPSTATTNVHYFMAQPRTQATAFTAGAISGFTASVPSLIGAGSAVTTMRGFWAQNQGLAGVTNAYGLWVDTQSGASGQNYGIVVSSATKFVVTGDGSQVSINAGINTQVMLALGGGNAHPGTGTTTYGLSSDHTAPATATTQTLAYHGRYHTAAAAFNMTNAYVYYADTPTIGAGSTIGTAYGMRIENQGNASVTNAFGLFIANQVNATTINTALAIGSNTTFSVGGSGNMSWGGAPNAARLALGTGNHFSTSTAIYGVDMEYVTPATATVSDYRFYAQNRTIASAFTLTAAAAFRVDVPIVGAGSTITTASGVLVANQGNAGIVNAYGAWIIGTTSATTLNVGLRVDTSTTAALWLGGDQAGTAATGGIVFGSSRDVNLYRNGVDILRTDDQLNLFFAGASLRVGASAGWQTTVGAAGTASALPAAPTKYLKIVDDAGTTLVVPAYLAA